MKTIRIQNKKSDLEILHILKQPINDNVRKFINLEKKNLTFTIKKNK